MSASIKRLFGFALSLVLLGVIFSFYFAPDMMVAITNSVWAMCGW